MSESMGRGSSYSCDLDQGGMCILPCTYTYSTLDSDLYKKLSELVADFMEDYQKRIKQIEEKNMKKTKKNAGKKYRVWKIVS